MADDVAMLETEVRELIRRRGLDPARDHEETRVLIADAVADYDERAMLGRVPRLQDPDEAAKALHDAVVGLGPLQKYLDDPEIEEIWINEPGKVFVARMGRSELTTTLLSAGQVRDLVERMLRTSGRRLDLSTPFVDASLPTGERLHAVIPDVTRAHWAVNIRKYVARASRLPDLVTLGSLTQQAAAFLDAAVASGLNVLVSGATQSGKTTMVNALAGSIPSHEHVITCEEVFELAVNGRIHTCERLSTPACPSIEPVRVRRSRASSRTPATSPRVAAGPSSWSGLTTTRPLRDRRSGLASRLCSTTSRAGGQTPSSRGRSIA